jgi:protein SCO1/2
MTTATIDHEAQSRGIKRTIFALLALIALIGLGFFYKFTQPRILSPSDLRANNVWVFETARIPRDFVLLDEHGETATNAIFEGKWTLIFFGFTNCPDICPSAMAQMRDMQAMLRDQGRDENVQYMLVSVDPDRDTPDVLGPYVEFFDPSFRALTGEYLTIKQLATDFNVAFSKVPGGGEFYSVDHSGNIAIVNPYGHYQGFIRPPFNPGQMVLTFNSVRASWRG